MNFTNYIVFALSFLSISTAFAQQKTVVIHGRITDMDNKGISFAAVQNSNSGTGINSDARGFYILKTTLPASLSAFALGYYISRKEVNQTDKDTIEVNFELPENPEELHPVVITASHSPEIIKEEVNLMDFELKGGKLWLVYSVKGGDKIKVEDTGGTMVTQLTLKYRFHKDSINQTPHGFLYSIYKDSIQLYRLDSNKIKITGIPLKTYEDHSGSLVGYRYPYYYYVHYDSVGNARVNYYYYDKSKNKDQTFYSYTDSKLLRSNRELEEILLVLQSELGLQNSPNGHAETMKENDSLVAVLGYEPDSTDINLLMRNVYLPEGATIQEVENNYAYAQQLVRMPGDPFAAENEAMALSMMKTTVFSILRIVNDSVYVFNFNNNTISVYTPDNEFVRQTPFGISAHAIRYRHKDILVDEEKQECYFKYIKQGRTYLEKINLTTGKVYYNIVLKFPYIDKVRILGGYAYFSYFNYQDKDNIYNGKMCLYKQRLD